MEQGRRRSDTDYRWPRSLLLPHRPPQLVYLDLNHWISLAKAHSGHPTGQSHRAILDTCVDAVATGRAVFPISDSVIFEITRIGRYRQRRDLQEVIEAVSGYRVITARDVISTHEIAAMLDELVGPNPRPINTMRYLDWGVARAFGMVGGFKVRDRDGNDVTAEARASHEGGPEAWDRLLMQAELDLQRKLLSGPTQEEEPAMRELGWRPRPAEETDNQRVQQERDQVKVLDADPHWRRGRLRDVVSAREILIEVNESLHRGFRERGADIDQVFDTPETMRRAMDSMPSFDVAVSIKTAYHRDPNHNWTSNDIHDIDALGSAVPYCDIVVTDKAVATTVKQSGVADRLDCTVVSRLTELERLL